MSAVAVIILEGWSNTPVNYLQYKLMREQESSQQSKYIFSFARPNLHMPPAGCRWCCNPWLPMIFCYVSIWVLLWRSSWFLSVATGGFLLNILSTIISLSCILWGLRFLIARLVRYSVDCSVQATLDTINIIRERDVQTRIVIVGFSWGGHILAEMLHRQVFPGPALLLAPTINAVASVCNSKLPQFRTSHELCKVVHASDDGFCPHSQHGHLRSCGAECVVVDDGHPLNNGRSLATILRLFKELL